MLHISRSRPHHTKRRITRLRRLRSLAIDDKAGFERACVDLIRKEHIFTASIDVSAHDPQWMRRLSKVAPSLFNKIVRPLSSSI
jgi:hypothetical protein